MIRLILLLTASALCFIYGLYMGLLEGNFMEATYFLVLGIWFRQTLNEQYNDTN